MRAKTIYPVIVAVAAIIIIALLCNDRKPTEIIKIERRTDTVTIRDTVEIPVPIPHKIYVARVDTITVHLSDTVEVPILIPVERKEYKTTDYYAVIEGYRPELISMTLFPSTKIITNTETQKIMKNQHFGVGIQVGYGIYGGKPQPYIGVGLQYNIISW